MGARQRQRGPGLSRGTRANTSGHSDGSRCSDLGTVSSRKPIGLRDDSTCEKWPDQVSQCQLELDVHPGFAHKAACSR